MSTENNYSGHYHTAGNGLMIVGFVNAAIATYSLSQQYENIFIDYQTMLLFSLSFIATGLWMKSIKD
jgi:hypothetical protein